MANNASTDHSWAYAGLETYAHWYWHIHGYVSLVICSFGIPTNIVNVIILTRKSMRTPINCILTGIAVSDILTMLSYMPFAVHFYIMYGLERTPEKYTYGWTLFLGIHAGLSVTTHTISMWLAVCMSIMRYVFLRSKGTSSLNLNYEKTCVLIITVYALSMIVSIPNYMLTVIEPVLDSFNETQYQLRGLEIGGGNTSFMNVLNTWLFIIIGKLAPCLLISIFGGLLLLALQRSKNRTKNLKGTTCGDRMKQHKRTTTMLLVIILMFIIAELPSAILISISVFLDTFFMEVYLLVGDTLDAVALINNAANFIMYCTMSQQFRDCLCEIVTNVFRCRKDKALYKFIGQHRTSTTVV